MQFWAGIERECVLLNLIVNIVDKKSDSKKLIE